MRIRAKIRDASEGSVVVTMFGRFDLRATIADVAQRFRYAEGTQVTEDAQNRLYELALQRGAAADINSGNVTQHDAELAITAVLLAARTLGPISVTHINEFAERFCNQETHLWWC